MIKCEVVFDGDLIYCNGLVIERGSFMNFVSNSDEDVVCDYATLEEAIKYCMDN